MRRLILLLLLTAVLAAQTATEVEITAEPHHHLVFANDQVRVFSVDVAPHTDTLLHWHRHDYIYVMLGASEISNEVEGKAPIPIKLHDGQAGFTPGPFAHIVRNHDQPFRNLTVEILQDEKLRQSTHEWDESRGLEILPGGTQEILFVKDGIRVSEFELQPKGEATISPGPYLLVALTDLDILQAEPNAPVHASNHILLKRGEARWFPAPHRSTLIHNGPAAKFVALEFP
jgi:hypothetical protein